MAPSIALMPGSSSGSDPPGWIHFNITSYKPRQQAYDIDFVRRSGEDSIFLSPEAS